MLTAYFRFKGWTAILRVAGRLWSRQSVASKKAYIVIEWEIGIKRKCTRSLVCFVHMLLKSFYHFFFALKLESINWSNRKKQSGTRRYTYQEKAEPELHRGLPPRSSCEFSENKKRDQCCMYFSFLSAAIRILINSFIPNRIEFTFFISWNV